MINDLTDDELKETDLKTSQAFLFCFAASGMLLLLYLFLEYIARIFEVLITFSGGTACATVI